MWWILVAGLVLGGGVRQGPVRVTEDGSTLDLRGGCIDGAHAGGTPDTFTGTGILVEGRKDVTIRGGAVRGCRCGILVRNCTHVVIEDMDCSGNFATRLRSTPEREDERDWLWPQKNDEHQYRKNYGAGICLENCTDCVIRRCKGLHQQNGLILDRCTRCQVYDCDFSFDSGWGIALWRSCDNLVCKNRCDFCVRGYSHGVYARGQDSAGLLVFEQSSRNLFAFNSATHGGDGFFLYAGNETLHETGKGGCNDNVLYGNDFRYAVANAIEATFSRGNRFVRNRCGGSDYGVWAGYSYETRIEGNSFTADRTSGVAIEHGSKNTISANTFVDCPVAISLWWDEDKELLKSAFAKSHDCKSKDYRIVANVSRGRGGAVRLKETTGVFRAANEGLGFPKGVSAGAASKGAGPPLLDERIFPGTAHPVGQIDDLRGVETIIVGEWGPRDPRVRDVFPRRVEGAARCVFHVLGPVAPITVTGLPKGLAAEVSKRRVVIGADAPGLFPFHAAVRVGGATIPIEGNVLRSDWTVSFWKWKTDPRKDDAAFAALEKSAPLAQVHAESLDFVWGAGAPAKGVPKDGFATRAEATIPLPAGRYEISTMSDDGVRVTLDGNKVLEDWTWHGPTVDRATIDVEAGRHSFVVEHFELDGWAVLRFRIAPVR